MGDVCLFRLCMARDGVLWYNMWTLATGVAAEHKEKEKV